MAEDPKEPPVVRPSESEPQKDTTASGTPSPSQIPPAGTLASADAEKAAMVEQAKTRVAAVKESLTTEVSAQPGAPKPPVKKKEEGPKPTDASGHPLVRELKERFADGIGEATEFLGQLSVRVNTDDIVEV